MLKDIEKVFKALGQPTRLKIVMLIANQTLCVCELEYILNLTQPAISQHMRVLKEADLVTENKEGQWVFYSLNKEKLKHILGNLNGLLDKDCYEVPGLSNEVERLNYLKLHPIVSCHRQQK